jgi:hypothetical protein
MNVPTKQNAVQNSETGKYLTDAGGWGGNKSAAVIGTTVARAKVRGLKDKVKGKLEIVPAPPEAIARAAKAAKAAAPATATKSATPRRARTPVKTIDAKG